MRCFFGAGLRIHGVLVSVTKAFLAAAVSASAEAVSAAA